MVKRSFDIAASALAMLVFSPIMLIAAVMIKLRSPGPILYRAQRVGLDGRTFTMHKFRTMHVPQEVQESVITAPNDTRIFPLGGLLRKLKIDELPQLWDVFRGEMSIVGPRPEDPAIVRDHYSQEMWLTLRVRPGLASPGSLFGSTHGDRYLNGDDPEGSYVENLLPVKLAVEQVYILHASFAYDCSIIWRTVAMLMLMLTGKKEFPEPPELMEARELLKSGDSTASSNHMVLKGT